MEEQTWAEALVLDWMQALRQAVPKEELERAKNAAVSQVLVNLESRAVVAEDIGRQVLTYGHRSATEPTL